MNDEQRKLMELFSGILEKNGEVLDSISENIETQTSLQDIIVAASESILRSLSPTKGGASTPSPSPTGKEPAKGNGIAELLHKIIALLQSFIGGTGTGTATATPGPNTTRKDKPQILMLPAPPGTTAGQLVPLGSPMSPTPHPRGGPLSLPAPTGTQMVPFGDKLGSFLSLLSQRLEQQSGTTSKMFQGMQALSRTELAKSTGLTGPLEKGMLATRAAAGDPTAIAQLGKEQVQKIKADFQAGFKGLSRAFLSERGSESLGEASSGLAKMAKYISPVAAGFLALGGIAFKLVDRLRMWGQQLHDSNMQWAEFSSGMSQVQAEQEVRDIQYSQARGQARARTAQAQAEAHSRLRESFAPIEDAFANLRNRIFTTLANVVNFGLRLTPIPAFANWVNERLGGGEEAEASRVFGRVGWLNNLPSDSDWMQSFNRPDRFNPGI